MQPSLPCPSPSPAPAWPRPAAACIKDANGKPKSILVLITDKCPECEANHLDVQALAFAKVRRAGAGAGGWLLCCPSGACACAYMGKICGACLWERLPPGQESNKLLHPQLSSRPHPARPSPLSTRLPAAGRPRAGPHQGHLPPHPVCPAHRPRRVGHGLCRRQRLAAPQHRREPLRWLKLHKEAFVPACPAVLRREPAALLHCSAGAPSQLHASVWQQSRRSGPLCAGHGRPWRHHLRRCAQLQRRPVDPHDQLLGGE